ncbi:23S rRNA m(2)A-2503 methyltransferase [Hathewaya proteolytica DSM 3090]|uniref:Probable dual-specificity RNA methyltransferase RlmN n=1 Tax=Hathewaya proteolytica DSM 3090 TaxID=1121331 RepID=A0A1M6JAH4_9CLOT|nr:23S rRNA (adenine(2503)-C(2))-methyltransferase RlmN [Hathewaya proteolytica]SHJ43663.1 23S rRNA m(2)A-2503 methyltransferase [Hathewaya proteolytica DSM 3090]
MINLLDLTLDELKQWMSENGENSFRAKQVLDWIYKGVFEFQQMNNIPKSSREKFNEVFTISIPRVLEKMVSKKDETRKYLLIYEDGNIIESVVMKYVYGYSICISTQIGCRMGCKFCASTIDGRVRDLTAGELIGEILAVQKDLGQRISNIVLMGSGEPLDNYENVIKFIKMVNEKYSLNIGQRHITLSTCGIVPKIYDLAREGLQITLAISLHAPNDIIRKQSMPVANSYSIDELIKSCQFYIDKTNRRVTFEYALIKGLNDSPSCAEELSKMLKGLLCHVNLIPINEVKEREYIKADKEIINEFKSILLKNGIEATLRREMGGDINAACGQLRRSYINGSKIP